MLENSISFKTLLTVLLISGLLACRQQTQTKEIQSLTKHRLRTNDKDYIAIFPAIAVGSRSILSAAEMLTVDSLLQKAVDKFNQETNTSRPDRFIDLKKYKRQYIVSLDEGKNKVVKVNCMCRVSEDDDWKTRELLFRDGGSCYFNLMVDINAKKYFEFMVNGEA